VAQPEGQDLALAEQVAQRVRLIDGGSLDVRKQGHGLAS